MGSRELQTTVSWAHVNYKIQSHGHKGNSKYSLIGSTELQNTVSLAHVNYKLQSHGHT